jgi:DNA repair protein RecO (recombination protein O)
MAIQTTEAIVLKKQNLRETSIILTMLTRDFGKIAGVIKGARGPRAAIGHNPQIFSVNDVVFYERKRGNLSNISHCDLKDFFSPIRDDLEKTVYADYFVELADTVTIEGDADKDLYGLLLNSLTLLAQPVSAKRVARIFEIKLMDAAGFMPELDKCACCMDNVDRSGIFSFTNGALYCGKCRAKANGGMALSVGTINFINRVKEMPFGLVSRIKVSQHVGRELEVFMRKFVDYHLQRKLKTLDFLRKVDL